MIAKKLPANLSLILAVLGPGLVVMLADTDAGSIIMAAQSGAVWGYRLLLLQFILIPILYVVQELTVRLGLVTGKGHGELIAQHFGKAWAWVSISTLIIGCLGALISEFSGLAGVGHLFGIPTWQMMLMVVLFLTIVAWSGSYKSVERIAILLGAFELIFIVVAWQANSHLSDVKAGLFNIPWTSQPYLYLAAGNIGAVIMPWMVFYQQSAVVDKGLTVKHLKIARWDTALGAILTQVIMIAVLMATAATIGKTNPGVELDTVHQISDALTPSLGALGGKTLFALGMTGAALVAAIVVSLTAAWGLGEVLGYKRSLQDHPKDAPWFYGIYTLALILGGAIVASDSINLVNLSVGIEVMNALLLPVVLGFLYLLARRALPKQYRLRGGYAFIVAMVLLITSGFGAWAGVWGLVGKYF